MRIFEYLFYGLLTFAFGWFSLRVFVGDRWSGRSKANFSFGLTVLLFISFGVYRLTTGQDPAARIQELIFCPLYPFSHCPSQEQPALVPFELQESRTGVALDLSHFREEFRKSLPSNSTLLADAVTEYAESHISYGVITVVIATIENVSDRDLLDVTIQASVWLDKEFSKNVTLKAPRVATGARIVIPLQVCWSFLTEGELSTGLGKKEPLIRIPRITLRSVAYRLTAWERPTSFAVSPRIEDCRFEGPRRPR
jgi:hypothetical protein